MFKIRHLDERGVRADEVIKGAEELGVAAEFRGLRGAGGVGINFFETADEAGALSVKEMEQGAAQLGAGEGRELAEEL